MFLLQYLLYLYSTTGKRTCAAAATADSSAYGGRHCQRQRTEPTAKAAAGGAIIQSSNEFLSLAERYVVKYKI